MIKTKEFFYIILLTCNLFLKTGALAHALSFCKRRRTISAFASGDGIKEAKGPASEKENSADQKINNKNDEEIRELTSDEYLEMLREWVPLAKFAMTEVKDSKIAAQAESYLEIMKGMQNWQPLKRGDFKVDNSDWAFGAPIAAFKNGNLDAVACIEVSESGVHIVWLCENPIYLGVPGNSADWLVKGIETLVGKKLEMMVTIRPNARPSSFSS